MTSSLRERFASDCLIADRVLVLAVGGGNDSVSSLLLLKQLEADFHLRPHQIDVACMLPDVLDYTFMAPTPEPSLFRIESTSQRSVQGHPITAFPEPLLVAHKETCGLPIRTVWGFHMGRGSVGILNALQSLLNSESYDLVLAFDVGGDFIALPENQGVLSPQMDGYLLAALQALPKQAHYPPIYGGLFGLGTDGESTPEMLDSALRALGPTLTGTFNPQLLSAPIHFYRSYVEPMRYSRTADLTILQILSIPYPLTMPYRARFHVSLAGVRGTETVYALFNHRQDERYFKQYWIFDQFQNIQNPYALLCLNGLEWALKMGNQSSQINHELNGQAYMNLGALLGFESFDGQSLFIGTPSHHFTESQQDTLARLTIEAVLGGVYDYALLWAQQQRHCLDAQLSVASLNKDFIVISRHPRSVLPLRNLLLTFCAPDVS